MILSRSESARRESRSYGAPVLDQASCLGEGQHVADLAIRYGANLKHGGGWWSRSLFGPLQKAEALVLKSAHVDESLIRR